MRGAAHLYVHVPFCARRCSYCSFAIAVRATVPTDAYVELLAGEIELRFRKGWHVPLQSLYLGGGTPSHLGGRGVRNLVRRIRAAVPVSPNVEITLEANPEDVTEVAASEWLEAGVNRVSLGVQSFSDAALTWMHRVHDAACARRALAILTKNFRNVSGDIIFALPGNIARDLGADVRELIQAGVAHLSIYGLTAEPRTPYARWIDRGETREAPEEQYEVEYLQLHELLTGFGYEHYEVSSFSQPSLSSAHNAAYWSGAAYVGVGPAAHGFDGVTRRWNVPHYKEWSRMVASGVDPVADSEELNAENKLAEEVYLGLRTMRGLPVGNDELARIQPWLASGWGQVQGGRLRLTTLGWLRLDSLAAALTMWRSR